MARSPSASRGLAAAALLLGLAGAALAQGGPVPPQLAAAERRLAATYADVLSRLPGPAREHLQADQARWKANRAAACIGDPADVADCLENGLRDRTSHLEWLAEGGYPFVSEQAIVKTGKARGIPYIVDASYPQFDGRSADFSAVNRQIAAATTEAADRAVPGPDADNNGGAYTGPPWSYEQVYTLHRPGPSAVTVYVRYDTYDGGPTGTVGVAGYLVDLRSGKAVGPEGVFLPSSPWLRELTRIVGADISAPNLGDLLKEPQRYVFLEDRLELSFGPHEGGPYTVEIRYDRLRPLLRVDGPVPRASASP